MSVCDQNGFLGCPDVSRMKINDLKFPQTNKYIGATYSKLKLDSV